MNNFHPSWMLSGMFEQVPIIPLNMYVRTSSGPMKWWFTVQHGVESTCRQINRLPCPKRQNIVDTCSVKIQLRIESDVLTSQCWLQH